jgi:regulatory protein
MKPMDPPKPPTRDEAFQYALRALTARALTESELERKLKRRKASPEIIRDILERLREYKFVDDAAVAERAATDASLGRYGIQRKLMTRGVSRHLIEDALETRDADADLEAALALVERHAGKWRGERAYQKASAFLMRRGFSGDVTRNALSDWAAQRQLEAEDLEDEPV